MFYLSELLSILLAYVSTYLLWNTYDKNIIY